LTWSARGSGLPLLIKGAIKQEFYGSRTRVCAQLEGGHMGPPLQKI